MVRDGAKRDCLPSSGAAQPDKDVNAAASHSAGDEEHGRDDEDRREQYQHLNRASDQASFLDDVAQVRERNE